jgi:hypothetical protein
MLQDYHKVNLAVVVVICLMLLVAAILWLMGCKPTMTEQQWQAQYRPDDVNQAAAMVVLEQGKAEIMQKVKAAARIDFAIFLCLISAIACGAAIVLGTTRIKQIAFTGFALCLGSAALLKFYQEAPMWFAYAGGGIALTAGAFAIWDHRNALREAVENVSEIKTVADSETLIGLDKIKGILAKQSPATKTLIAKIRGKK